MAREKTQEACPHCGAWLAAPRKDEEKGPGPEDRWLILGMTGTGKSYKHQQLIAQWLKNGRDVIAWDPHDEYSRHGKNKTLGVLRDRATVWQVLEDRKIITAEPLSLAVVPTWPDDEGRLERLAGKLKLDLDDWHPQLDVPSAVVAFLFTRFAPWVKQRGDLIVALDEIGEWGMASLECAALLDTIAAGWRKAGVAVSAACQFMTQAPAGFRSQLTRIYSGRQGKRAHLSLLAAETSKAFARQVRRAKPREFFVTDVWDEPTEEE